MKLFLFLRSQSNLHRATVFRAHCLRQQHHLHRYCKMSSSSYTGQAPSGIEIDPRIIPFYEKFYAISDTHSDQAHEEYADTLTKDGTLIIGTKKAVGREEILALRKGMWSGPVNKRQHHLHRIYPYGPKSNDVMLHGSVDYGLKNGKSVSVDWAAHAQLEEAGSNLKMKFYQVYIDSSPVAAAASGTAAGAAAAPANSGHKRGMSSIDMAKLGGGKLYEDAVSKMGSS